MRLTPHARSTHSAPKAPQKGHQPVRYDVDVFHHFAPLGLSHLPHASMPRPACIRFAPADAGPRGPFGALIEFFRNARLSLASSPLISSSVKSAGRSGRSVPCFSGLMESSN
jgi:hypothetical protein